MDKEFMRKPVTDEAWEYNFTKKMEAKGIHGYKCKVITKMSEFYYQYNQDTEYCNIFVTNMYYWAPISMSNLENKGTHLTEWSNRLLKTATKDVFWFWKKTYKQLKIKN
jgi:hypothetical protein